MCHNFKLLLIKLIILFYKYFFIVLYFNNNNTYKYCFYKYVLIIFICLWNQ